MSRIGDKASTQRWQNFDQQSAVSEESHSVDHGASAMDNLKEAGQNLSNTFDPSNHIRAAWDTSHYGSSAIAQGLGLGVSVLLTPWAIAGEVADVVVQPVAMMKNLVDAGIHGVAAGIQALRDE